MTSVMVSSGLMRTKALGAKVSSATCALAPMDRGRWTPSSNPPPAAAAVTRNVRRERPFSSLLWSIRFSIVQLFASSGLRCLFDGGANALIGAATTDIARHGGINLGVGRIGIALKKSRGGHDLARLAVAALHDFNIEPSPLDLGSAFGFPDRFDGCDLLADHVGHRRDARSYRAPVKMDGAGPAQRDPATELRSRQADDVAQHP